MVVTLPCVLLLLDYWPFARSNGWKKLILEKVPFFALATIECIATIWAQKGGHAVVSTASLPVGERISNAVVSYVLYLGKTFWPADLAVPYPYSHEWTLAQAADAALLLVAVSAWVLLRMRAMPHLAVGWFWFLGTLVPVIGLVQVGLQFMADRYTYIPLIGIFIMLAWSIPTRWIVWPRPGLVSATVGAAVLALLLMTTSVQVMYWQNSVTLFTHSAAVTEGSILTEYNLGEALAARGNDEGAAAHYLAALAIKPNRVEAQYNSHLQAQFNLGLIYRKQGKWSESAEQFRAVLKLDPTIEQAWTALALLDKAQADAGRFPDAIATAQKTRDAALAAGRKDVADAAEKRLTAYRDGKTAQ
jgi:hypothetical protein